MFSFSVRFPPGTIGSKTADVYRSPNLKENLSFPTKHRDNSRTRRHVVSRTGVDIFTRALENLYYPSSRWPSVPGTNRLVRYARPIRYGPLAKSAREKERRAYGGIDGRRRDVEFSNVYGISYGTTYLRARGNFWLAAGVTSGGNLENSYNRKSRVNAVAG